MNAYQAAQWAGHREVVAYLKSIGAHRASQWKPITAGVHSTDDFSEILAKADVETVAHALAKMIGGKPQANAYDQTLPIGKQAFVVARPKEMAWCNVLQIAPVLKRVGQEKKTESFCKDLAAAADAAVLSVIYSDTSDAAAMIRYEPDGTISRDDAGEETRSTQRLEKLAKAERFAVAILSLVKAEKKRTVELAFIGYPKEAFDGVAIVSAF